MARQCERFLLVASWKFVSPRHHRIRFPCEYEISYSLGDDGMEYLQSISMDGHQKMIRTLYTQCAAHLVFGDGNAEDSLPSVFSLLFATSVWVSNRSYARPVFDNAVARASHSLSSATAVTSSSSSTWFSLGIQNSSWVMTELKAFEVHRLNYPKGP